MTDFLSFIGAINAAPDDDTPRLVLADWLEENRQAERAEFIRLQVDLAKAETWKDRARFPLANRRVRQLVRQNKRQWCHPLMSPLTSQMRFEDGSHRVGGYWGESKNWGFVQFHRGIIERVGLPWEHWVQNVPAIVAATALRMVNFHTPPDLRILFDQRAGEVLYLLQIRKNRVRCRRGSDLGFYDVVRELLNAEYPDIDFVFPLDCDELERQLREVFQQS